MLRRRLSCRDPALLLRRCLARLEQVTDAYHLVLHTSPNTGSRRETPGYWTTLQDDYHWHIEILPIARSQSKSYSIKEAYYCPTSPESAAARLKDLPSSRHFLAQRSLEFKSR